MYLPFFVGVLCLVFVCYALRSVLSSFFNHLDEDERSGCFNCLSDDCDCLCSRLQCVILVFPDHTHLLFNSFKTIPYKGFI